ncbi:hypothetical protein KSP40_PGU013399 [Platanthera guangdongensis]|uniref:Trafficking protein particle complex subunit 13 N-terminal domain-containing protein n=1 Tax=Platanthera guangdongensis TaxID=2320717 RepID=A0ABR2MLV6_9ASPA
MSALHTGGSPSSHSLAFRVMRLCRPSFQAEDGVLRLDPFDLLAGEDLFNNPLVSPIVIDQAIRRQLSSTSDEGGGDDFSFRSRFQLLNPSDAMALPGFLILPQSFGGSLTRVGDLEDGDVELLSWDWRWRYDDNWRQKAEIQTEKQRILLLDTSKSPVESIRSGGRYDFIVEHDVKELGPHTDVSLQ